MKRILSAVRRAVDDYGMIEDGDRIAVGVSAGKDSLTLVAALAALRRFYPKRFELGAVTVDMGFEPPCDFSAVREFCEGLDVPYHVVPTEIAKIVFDVRKEKNPCGLCAKMRRGALHDECVRLGYWAKSVRKEFLLKRQIILNSLVTLFLIGIISLVVTNGATLSLSLIVFVWLGIFNLLPICIQYAIYSFISKRTNSKKERPI